MTRAEYQAKYGAPAAAAAPVQMTRAQYETKYGTAPTAPTIVSGLKEDFARRNQTVQQAKANTQSGKQSTASGIFQSMGQAAGLITDVGAEAAKAVDRTVTGGKIGDFLSKGLSKVASTAPVQKAISGYGAFKSAHPEAAGNVEAAANIGGIVPVGEAAGLAARGATAAGKVAGRETAVLASKAGAKVALGAKSTLSKGASAFTGVPQDVLERAASPERAHMTERAIAHVSENEKQPFLDLTNRAAQAVREAQRTARVNLKQAKDNFRAGAPDTTFDVSPKIPQIVHALEPFRSSGLLVKRVVQEGKAAYRVEKTVQSPFSAREVGALNNLLNKMLSSKNVDIDNLLALRQSFNAAYNDIPLGNYKTPTPYHAAIMAMKADAEKAIDSILPVELRQSFRDYNTVEDMKDDLGNRLLDGEGNVKHTAEQFVANLGNTNKGELRGAAERFKNLTGMDLEAEMQAIKDAQKLVPLFPSTASRTQDILRSLAVGGLGSFAGGPVGSMIGLAATSPRVAGKVAIKLGKYLAKKADQSPSPTSLRTPNAAQSAIKNIAPKTAPMTASVPQNDVPSIHPDTSAPIPPVKSPERPTMPKTPAVSKKPILKRANPLIERIQGTYAVTPEQASTIAKVYSLPFDEKIATLTHRKLTPEQIGQTIHHQIQIEKDYFFKDRGFGRHGFKGNTLDPDALHAWIKHFRDKYGFMPDEISTPEKMLKRIGGSIFPDKPPF